MLQQIIDRRLSARTSRSATASAFSSAIAGQIREAVRRAVSGARHPRHSTRARTSTVPKRDVSEPCFSHGTGGSREYVVPGNQDFARGDRIATAAGGGGGGSGDGEASPDGEGEDDFVFTLSREEFMQYFFEDLALPAPDQDPAGRNPEWKSRRAASPATARRTTSMWCARCAVPWAGALRWAANGAASCALEALLAEARKNPNTLLNEIAALEEQIEVLKRPPAQHSLPRSDRPALPQSRAGGRSPLPKP